MKVLLENPLENYFNQIDYLRIIDICLASTNESDLRENIKNFFTHFPIKGLSYGYGHNHFWVCEKENNKRIIFVEF